MLRCGNFGAMACVRDSLTVTANMTTTQTMTVDTVPTATMTATATMIAGAATTLTATATITPTATVTTQIRDEAMTALASAPCQAPISTAAPELIRSWGAGPGAPRPSGLPFLSGLQLAQERFTPRAVFDISAVDCNGPDSATFARLTVDLPPVCVLATRLRIAADDKRMPSARVNV